MRIITLEEYQAELKAQGVEAKELMCMVCPSCHTVQCAADLIQAGAGGSLDGVEGYLGFSCVGRWTDKTGCNWTLGGLFQLHELEVQTDDGEKHPRFEVASPSEAMAHLLRRDEIWGMT